MTRLYNKRKLNFILLFLAAGLTAFPQTGHITDPESGGSPTQTVPVIRWTAGSDPMNFRYDFLDNIRNVSLYKAIPETGTFSHHGHITLFKGIVYAYWDKQIKDENGSGQHGVYCYSADQGITWTAPVMLFPPHDHMVPAEVAYIGRRFQTANGFAVVEDVLYAVSDVADWTGPGIEQRERISIGRICRSVNDDGRLGEIFWLADKAPAPVEGFPSYPAGDPVIVKEINDYFGQPGQEIQLNFTTPHPVSDDNHKLIEPVPSWRLADGTCVRLYRDGGARDAKTSEEVESTKVWRNYASFSFDNGITWTVPARTSFPDACSRTHAGRLPDGQYYVINNVLPLSTKYGGRSLLAISLSRDGLVFDRMAVIRFLPPAKRYEGRAKTVGFAYPHSVVAGDTLMVIYSVNKEDMQLSYLPLKELYNIK